jgi:hypothetical protein
LRVIQCFFKRFSCHLQGEYVSLGHFWQAYVVQAMGGTLDVMELICGAEEQDAASNPTRCLLPALHKSAKNDHPMHIHH